MNKYKTLALTSSMMLLGFTNLAKAEDSPEFQTVEVSQGIYMLMGVNGFVGGNIGLSVGEDGVVMIDDSMPPFIDKLNKTVMKVTNKPIDFLINTHVHGDHTGNNESFGKNGVHLVAHENLRQHLINKGVSTPNGTQPAPKAALPVITFSESMSFHLNGEDSKIFHVPHAHTDGDAIVHFKNANVIHMGDTLFNGMFPFIDLDSGGSVDGVIQAQQTVLHIANDKTKIIPGHGPLATKADLQKNLEMIIDCKKIIKKLIDAGKTEAEVVAENPLKKYHEKYNWQFITTEKMTRQLYAGLSKSSAHSDENGRDHKH